jgi:hypothetical protein
LITGQERVEMPGARHVACTVEMANINAIVDVAVIDEIQARCLICMLCALHNGLEHKHTFSDAAAEFAASMPSLQGMGTLHH